MSCRHDNVWVNYLEGEGFVEYRYYSGDGNFWSIDPPGWEIGKYIGEMSAGVKAYLRLNKRGKDILICRKCGECCDWEKEKDL